jgi:hypothetical protein
MKYDFAKMVQFETQGVRQATDYIRTPMCETEFTEYFTVQCPQYLRLTLDGAKAKWSRDIKDRNMVQDEACVFVLVLCCQTFRYKTFCV